MVAVQAVQVVLGVAVSDQAAAEQPAVPVVLAGVVSLLRAVPEPQRVVRTLLPKQ